MKPKTSLRVFLATIGCATIAISSASAQDGTWNQSAAGTYDWSDTGNWLGGDVANGVDANALFNVTPGDNPGQTINLDIAVTLGSFSNTWNNRALFIEGPETLTFAVTAGTPTLSNTTRPIRISSVVAGNQGLEFTGGTAGAGIALAGANTFTGGIHLNSGSLGNNQNSTSAAGLNGNAITVSGTSWAAFDNGTNINGGVHINDGANFRTGANNGTTNITGALTGSGTLTHQVYGAGNQTITITDGSAFTGNIDYDKVRSTVTRVNSLGDAGRIRLGVSSPFQANREHVFEFGNGGTADLVFDNRQIEIMGSLNLGGYGFRASNTSHAMVINTDIINSHTGATVEFRLSGGSTQANTIAGAITDGPGDGDDPSVLSVVKLNNGSWTFSGQNTYTGNTTVSAGTLTLADSSMTTFSIGDNNVNNAILGTGTINLDGMFFFDLTSASTNAGDFWNIVAVGSLNESYGSTFNVDSTLGAFTEDAGVWSLTDNGLTWEFSQDTGILTVIPEPVTALLGGLGLLTLLRRRR
jgi:autotransporter-associated beta strand protein